MKVILRKHYNRLLFSLKKYSHKEVMRVLPTSIMCLKLEEGSLYFHIPKRHMSKRRFNYIKSTFKNSDEVEEGKTIEI